MRVAQALQSIYSEHLKPNKEKAFKGYKPIDEPIYEPIYEPIRYPAPNISDQHPVPEVNFQVIKKIEKAKKRRLKKLDLSYSNNQDQKLTEIPEEVFDLKHIQVLKLSNNNLNMLSDKISNLPNLTHLYLDGNWLVNLPESIGDLHKLTVLNVERNLLRKLPESIGKLTNLEQLFLKDNRISNLPDSVENLSELSYFDLDKNSIKNLPDSIQKCNNITNLNLANNQLKNLSESITKLKKISELKLNNNQLENLPESIGELNNLINLELDNNQLKNLPNSIGNLNNLTKISLWRNQLEKLPESIGNLNNLIEVIAWGNKITNLPNSIGKLNNLTWLNLLNNRLTNLPRSIGKLSNSIRLNLSGNPLREPPIEIAEKGIKEIREYFQQLREEGEDYIYEAKLLIIGEAEVGKTTLANKIKNSDYKLKENQPATQGIDIIEWRFDILDYEQKERNHEYKKRKFKVHIWDFGGQEIYHATHQFFLTKRSLYTLVADTRRQNTDFDYWLNIVKLLSNNSPLLIIKNEKEDIQMEINELALRGQFDNFKETLATNLKTNRGLDNIVTNIQDYIKKLPHIGQVLPKTWVKVKNFLESDDRDYISLQDFFAICEANGLTRRENKLQLSRYLHDLGVCLHFQEEEDSLLYRTVILKPEWGTDAVYKVLDNKQVISNQGCFTRDDLKNIWQEERYADRRGELLELMKKFQLCYEIPYLEDTFVAPQLLRNQQLDYDWNGSENMILYYSYPDFMPKGILTRFIVIMHQYIDQQKYVWKTGVILNKDNTKAEVIEYYGKRKIEIKIEGRHKKELLNTVTYELDKIHDSYNKLKYSKLMPCNCSQCKKENQLPYFYSFDTLRKFIADRQYNIQCQESYQMVNVLNLIDDAIDLKKLISKNKQDSKQLINNEQFNSIPEDVRERIRTIIINKIEGDYLNVEGEVGIAKMSDSVVKDQTKVAGKINETEGQNQ